MTLASQAKIRVAETKPIRLADGHVVAIKRFDRKNGKHRTVCPRTLRCARQQSATVIRNWRNYCAAAA
jgi:hypothetical protein